MLDRHAIAKIVPQAGDMCLLDAVLSWDARTIDCRATPPGPAHPLLRGGKLPAIAGCECAAQAAAVHGALLEAADAPREGMLAKLMDVHFEIPHFSLHAAPHVHVEAISRTAGGCLYEFEVAQDSRCVVRGRLMVAFASPAPE